MSTGPPAIRRLADPSAWPARSTPGIPPVGGLSRGHAPFL